MASHHVIDYDSFLSRLVAGLRNAWQEVRAQRADETFYMFGVQTDPDVTVLTPFCQTHEQYKAERGDAEAPIEKWAVDQDSELYGSGSKYTADLEKEVNRYARAVTVMLRFYGRRSVGPWKRRIRGWNCGRPDP